jgi:hypothetical protein
MMESNEGEEPTPVEKFVDNIYPQLNLKAPGVKTKKKKDAINNLITNVLIATKDGKVLALPRGRSKYANSTFYGFGYYTNTFIVGAFDAITRSGYLECRKGFYDNINMKGEVSRVWATCKLLNEIDGYTAISLSYREEEEEPCRIHYLFGRKLTRRNHSIPIVLKDSNKNFLRYKLTNKVAEMQMFLNRYNELVESNAITIPKEDDNSQPTSTLNPAHQTVSGKPEYQDSPSIGPPLLGLSGVMYSNYKDLDCRLYRVFNNGKFTEGGRFYGGEYQSLNERLRAEILINGQNTCEVDYSAMHARMLYHRARINCKSDPYQMVSPEPELRLPIKKMMQIIINAKSQWEAVGAFKDYLQDEPELYTVLSDRGLTAWNLSEMVMQAHEKIEKYFNTGIGVKLQYQDSKIAERILKHFTRKNIVCLCIHDSFIVEEKYKDELIEVMKEEYKREMGFECELKYLK